MGSRKLSSAKVDQSTLGQCLMCPGTTRGATGPLFHSSDHRFVALFHARRRYCVLFMPCLSTMSSAFLAHPPVALLGWLRDPNVQLSLLDVVRLLFVFAFGACIGSLMNVLVYRIPRGLPFVTPTSRCPSCGTKLTANENIPIFGWLFLRGKCRFCRTSISAEYPLVEFGMAILWVFTYAVIYCEYSSVLSFLRPLQPEWGMNGFGATWPIFIVIVILMSFLFGMTLVDAKTFTIPREFTDIPLVVGLVGHVGWALWVQYGAGQVSIGNYHAPDVLWSFASPGPYGWPMIGAAIGGAIGVGVANVLLWRGVIKPSFADYAQWEQSTLDEAQKALTQQAVAAQPMQVLPTSQPSDALPSVQSPLLDVQVGSQVGSPEGAQHVEQAPANPPGAEPDQQALWQMYPHARREMKHELLFILPILSLASVGAWVAIKTTGPWIYNPATIASEPSVVAPLWLCVLAGCLLGYLIGAGVVWAMRIMGSLLFGKEALGMGDVHMMGCVGVCLGSIDPVLAFFGAAFLGMFGFIIGKVFFSKSKTVLPYGPYLALGTMLVFFLKPLFEKAGTLLMAADPPLNLP